MDILAAILVSLALSVVASQIYDYTAAISDHLVRWSAARLHKDSDRYLEEWLSHLNDCHGNLSKAWHAIGCTVASCRLTPVHIGLIDSLIASSRALAIEFGGRIVSAQLLRRLNKAAHDPNVNKKQLEEDFKTYISLHVSLTVLRNHRLGRPLFDFETKRTSKKAESGT